MSGKPTFGLSMIVRNEAHNLGRLLPVATKIFDQIVIVDTGSDDGTYEYIRDNFPTITLEKFVWVDDFSAARNYSLSLVSTDVWMWLDADDIIEVTSAKGWKKLAQDMEVNHYTLPYWYAVDDAGRPVSVQYRERIMRNPRAWVWKEPVHEVCCFIDHTAECCGQIISDFPVIHKPQARRMSQANRNWGILHQSLEKGDRSVRTLFYILRDAYWRGQEEYGIQVGRELLASAPSGWIKDETYQLLAQCYSKLDEQYGANSTMYGAMADSCFQECIKLDTERNDFRYDYVNFLLRHKQVATALEQSLAMTTVMPSRVTALSPELYGSFPLAVQTRIYAQELDCLQNAVETHLQCLDYSNPHKMVMENHAMLGAHLKNNKIALVYADKNLMSTASLVKTAILEQGKFKSVIITTDPKAQALAQDTYYHITDDWDSLYREDCLPSVKKVLLTNSAKIQGEAYGWRHVGALPSTKEEAVFIVEEVESPLFVWHINKSESTVEEALRSVRGTDKAQSLLMFAFAEGIAQKLTQPIARDKVRVAVDSSLRLIGIFGWTDNIQQLMASDNELVMHSVDGIEFYDVGTFCPSLKGVEFKIRLKADYEGKIAFYASGLEEWDGTTPHIQGIGASETGVIYVAEQFALQGYDVRVFNTVSYPRIVNGVQYIPMHGLDNTMYDLFISSRIPEVLDRRRGKTQVLWTHDAIGQYGESLKTCLADKIVCVSDWQRRDALRHGLPAHKVVAINNGINMYKTLKGNRVTGRSVWISQPERGLHNITQMASRAKVFNDLWVLYGFYNISVSTQGNLEMFKSIQNLKCELRSIGAKIVGRLPIKEVKEFLTTVDFWAYPSSFPETFCVSALECVSAGVYCLVQENGATAETLGFAHGTTGIRGNVEKFSSESTFGLKDISMLTKAIKERDTSSRKTRVPKKYDYKNIVEEWKHLINH